MRRPLAACGFTFLIASLAACLLPAGLPLILGVPLACLFVFYLLLRRKFSYLPLLLIAASAALLFRAGYDAVLVRPVQALAGREALATARVEDLTPGYGGDTVHAVLTVRALDGEAISPFRAEVRGLPEVEIGDVVELPLKFYSLGGGTTASINGAKGRHIGARAAGEPQRVGEDLTPLGRFRLLRYAAGDNIREKLPARLASVMAAMAVGDRRTVSEGTSEAYRMAGLSHLLVVSGLHLSILAALVYGLFQTLLHRRRLAAGTAIAATLFFMALTGFTPSILRSGLGALLVLLGPLLGRKADLLTSLGLAALVLCLQNPYAAADAGLLLSFSATLGAVGGGRLWTRLMRGRNGGGLPARFGRKVAQLALVSVAVTLATLPVIIWISGGVALLTVPMNVLAVPLLAPIVVCGLLLALPGAGPLLLITRPATLVGGGLLVVLEKLTDFAAAHPALYLPVGGLFGLAVVLLVYGLVFLAIKTRRRKSYLIGAAALMALALGLHLALGAGTVRLTVAGSGAGSSLVVTKDGQALVLYRGRLSSGALRRALDSQRAKCVLLVDLRQNPTSTEYEALLSPDETIVTAEELTGREILQPLEGLTLYLAAQGDGTLACVEIEGYKVALATGSVDLGGYATPDVLVAGGGAVAGEYRTLLVTGTAPDWAAGGAEVLYADGPPQIFIRPGTSAVIRQARPDNPY